MSEEDALDTTAIEVEADRENDTLAEITEILNVILLTTEKADQGVLTQDDQDQEVQNEEPALAQNLPQDVVTLLIENNMMRGLLQDPDHDLGAADFSTRMWV